MLTDETHEYLESLPSLHQEGEFTLAHGSPRQPVWEYILDPLVASINFRHFESQCCLVGHTHTAVIFEKDSNGDGSIVHFPRYDKPIRLESSRLIINPGSVGQPRDGDPQASYAIYDSQTRFIRLCRIAYDIEDTQNRMVERGLPLRLAARLERGI